MAMASACPMVRRLENSRSSTGRSVSVNHWSFPSTLKSTPTDHEDLCSRSKMLPVCVCARACECVHVRPGMLPRGRDPPVVKERTCAKAGCQLAGGRKLARHLQNFPAAWRRISLALDVARQQPLPPLPAPLPPLRACTAATLRLVPDRYSRTHL